MKKCPVCSKEFSPKAKHHIYCCTRCRGDKWNKSEKGRASQKRHRDELKRRFIEMYGGRCACCGEEDHHFLTLDHKLGRTNKQKYPSGGGNQKEYRRALRFYNPEEFQVLCMNCNAAKFWYGTCPHQRKDDPNGGNEVLRHR